MSRCTDMAEQLLQILSEEAAILKRFAAEDLMALLPSKEMTVRELEEELIALSEFKAERRSGELALQFQNLKSMLNEIEKLNRANEVFITGSLAYWQDFISLFIPPSYGPNAEGSTAQAARFRGLSFNKEA